LRPTTIRKIASRINSRCPSFGIGDQVTTGAGSRP
jgi:hypothetical protein